MTSLTIPEHPVMTSIPVAENVLDALGPQLPVRTVCTPFSAIIWADWMPAPPLNAILGFSMAVKSGLSVSAMIKNEHRPNLGSTAASKVGPVALTAIFI